jgi:hypothetical protein
MLDVALAEREAVEVPMVAQARNNATLAFPG